METTSECSDCGGEELLEPSLLLLVPVLLSVVWAVVQLLYGPWLMALLLTKVVNVFLKDSGISIGSIHINLLTRRVLFKDMHYYCRDYSIRVVNGYAGIGGCKTCCSCSAVLAQQRSASMFVQLEGVEYHWYNRSEAYDHYGCSTAQEIAPEVEESSFWAWWKARQPTLHFSITKGRLVLGNHQVERSLVVHFTQAEAHYCTVEASTPYDELLHRVEVDATKVMVAMECSHGYMGPTISQPPDCSNGCGYRLLETDTLRCVFSQDSPGLVPLGDTPPPKYEFSATLGDNTSVTYGSYANNLRKLLQFAIFPNDHMEQVVSRKPQPGERRVHSMFAISISLAAPAKVDIPFCWKQSVHSLTLSLGRQSHLEILAPWLTDLHGSSYTIRGQFQEVGVVSSLPYPCLGCVGSMGCDVTLDFPRLWNGIQKWDMKFSGHHAQVNILFAYIDFVNALLDDWVGEEPSDLLDQVPVDWTVSVDLEQYEIFLLANRYNWLDLSSGGVENTRLAFCGASGQLSLRLPFTNFIPLEQLVQFSAKGQDLVIRHYAPPSTIARDSMFALSAANRYRWRLMDVPIPEVVPQDEEEPPRKSVNSSHQRCSSPKTAQTDSAHNSHLPLSSQPSSNSETEHAQLLRSSPPTHIISAPIIGDATPLDILNRPFATPTPDPTTPMATVSGGTPGEREHQLESREFFPMGCRFETLYERGWLDLACGPSITIDIEYKGHQHDPKPGSSTPLTPSSLHVDIDAPQVLIRGFGCLVRDLLSLKENYPGGYINMTPFRSNVPDAPPTAQDSTAPSLSKAAQAEAYDGVDDPPERTIDITVSFKLRNILAEFPVDVGVACPVNFPLPSLCTDELSIMVDYTSSDTKVRLHVDPLSVHVPSVEAGEETSGFSMGHMVISSVNFNCHGLTEYLCQERVEYAWMMQLLVGRIVGAMSPRQLLHAADWFLTLVTQVVAIGDDLAVAPDGELIVPRVEPVSEKIKYQLFQLDVQGADLHICQGASLTRLQAAGLDLDFCSLHQTGQTMGVSWQLHSLTATSYLPDSQDPSILLQVGVLQVGRVSGDVSVSESSECVTVRQRKFLHRADRQTKRLWFLWEHKQEVCGCCGGCVFLEGCLARHPLTSMEEAAVYGPQFAPLAVVPRQLGIPGLGPALQETSVDQLGCMRTIHKSLLDHYVMRYGGTLHQLVKESQPSSLTNSDSEIFHSARSSLTSGVWFDEESVKVQLQEKVQGDTPHRTKRGGAKHERHPLDDIDVAGDVEEQYSDLVPSCYLHSANFYVPQATPTNRDREADGEWEGTPTEYHSQREEPGGLRAPQSPYDRSKLFNLYVPCLQRHGNGSLPKITPISSLSTLERRKHTHFMSRQSSSQPDHTPKVSMSVRIGSENVLQLSPLFLEVLESVVVSAKVLAEGRSAMAVLNWTSFMASLGISDLISRKTKQSTSTSQRQSCPAHESPTPMAGIHLNIAPGAFVAIQLLQHAPPKKLWHDDRHHSQLQEVVSHKSLMTLYLSGTNGHIMLKTSQSTSSPSNSRRSVWVGVEVKLPVVQFNMVALVPKTHGCSALPGLVKGQQQLEFSLEPLCDPDHLCYEVQDLLEAGLKEAWLSVPATVVTSRVERKGVVLWEEVVEGGAGPDSEATETAANSVGVRLSITSLWSQLAAPQSGVARPSSGGLDLLVAMEAVEVWQERLPRLVKCVEELIQSKADRERQVLLALVTFATKVMCVSKSFSPVLHESSVKFRRSVWFSCLQHLWNSLCFFTEISVPTDQSLHINQLVLAAMLTLAAKIFPQKRTEAAEDLVLSQRVTTPTRPSSRSNLAPICNTGYVSVSPSPSDLAVPNRLYGSDLDEDVDVSQIFSQVSTDTLKLLKESLQPFFSSAGVSSETGPLSLNNRLTLDFTLELREATVFVLEYLATPPGSTYLHTRSMAATPALFLGDLVFLGSVEHKKELENAVSQTSLLSRPSQTSSTKMGVVSNCCASLDDVHIVVNAPLLKLLNHVTCTGKLRRTIHKHSKLRAADNLSTPRPPPSTSPSKQHNHFTLPTSAGGHVTRFAENALREISSLESHMSPEGSNPGTIFRLVAHPSSPRVVDGDAPKPPQDHTLSAPCLPASLLDSSVGLPQSSHHSHYSSSVISSDEETGRGAYPRHKDNSITVEEGTSPEDPPSTMDTCGDTTDSPHIVSSDNEESQSRSGSRTLRPLVPIATSHRPGVPVSEAAGAKDQTAAVSGGKGMAEGRSGLFLPQENLLFSVFALLKCRQVSCEVQIETTRACLTFLAISGSLDTRSCDFQRDSAHKDPTQQQLLSEVLPTYLSMAATLKKTVLRVSDRGLPECDLLHLDLLPMYTSVAVSNHLPHPPSYRCLLKLTALNLELRQSAVKVHKRFQQLMPSFTNIYHDIFGKEVMPVQEFNAPVPSAPGISVDSLLKLPVKLPVGLVHLSLEKTTVFVAPLPSLVVTYNLAPVTVKADTNPAISFQLVVGEHVLRFNPKDQFKNELSLRSLTLPYLCLQGNLRQSKKKKLPQLTVDLFVKKLNIDLTTDVLNQLLVVQNTFIKELNELMQMLSSVGEALPHRDKLASLSKRRSMISIQPSGSSAVGGVSFMSLFQTCHLSLAGVAVTVSTPLATAIRFSTGKIDMTLANTSSQSWPWPQLPDSAKNQLSLDGRVEIDINLALGYLKPVAPDVEDDLCELAYFRTKVAVRNTLQNLQGTDDKTKDPKEQDQPGWRASGPGEGDSGTTVDTFVISIGSPHLYLQSSAIEQAILFWLNCKSVYSYWQNEKKQLNEEVQQATEALMEKIQRPSRAPSIDFSKPRLVQISVSDVGACMPIIPVSSTEHTAQRQFPAIVVTIKEMQFLLNLSHKVASTGRFQTFCVRFAEQFSPRQRMWTLDPKKFKMTNYGTITRGTFRLCIATKKRFSDKNPSVAVGEKLLSAFQWDMSGININTNTDVGRHTSTLVRTMTTIASGLDGQEERRKVKPKPVAGSGHSPKSQLTKLRRHKRSSSVHRPSQSDHLYKEALEQELARQTSKIQRLKLSGATMDSVRSEEAVLRATQQELSKTVQRMFRHPRSRISLHSINQIFFHTPETTHTRSKPSLKTRLFSVNEETEGARRVRGTSPVATATSQRAARRGHRRYVSDLTGMRRSSPTRSQSPPIGEEEEEEEELEDDVIAGVEGTGETEDVSRKTSQDGFSLPSIDLEFDITVNVDRGKIVLRTEESASAAEWRRLHATSMNSPFTYPRKMSTEHKHFIESVLLIPALTVKTHYQSIVGRSYLNTTSPYLPSSPQKLVTAPTGHEVPLPSQEEPEGLPSLPVKRGVLSLHAVVESLPEHIKLTPSLLDFIEQVAQPTLAAANLSSSSSSDSINNDEQMAIKEEEKSAISSSPLSFPVDIILTFNIQPSRVYLTCQPHSQVECTIQSPNVSFVISFSLFSHQLSDGAVALDTSSPTASITGPNAKVVPFNNLYVTGCLSTFVLQLYSAKSGAKPGAGSSSENREALSLTLGQALFHLSRKSVSAPMLGRTHKTSDTVKSVDDYHTHNKLQVSVIMNVASLVLGHDMRRLNDITAFRRYWYRTSLVEAIFIGSKKEQEKEATSMVLATPPGAVTGSDSVDGVEDARSNTINLDNSVSAAIVVAANVEDFRVSANVAQVMGNADLLVSHLKCMSHCDVSHNELVLFQLAGKLVKGEFDARAGVIAGSILMEDANVLVLSQSQQGSTPEHFARASLSLAQGKVDYMGLCILLARATELKIGASDSWEGLQLEGEQEEGYEEWEELASIQVKVQFNWRDLQVAIHRSTTQHLFNIVEKLYDFIVQQKRRSERTLGNMLPAGSTAKKLLQAYRDDQEKMATTVIREDSRHHWLWAVKVWSMELMEVLGIRPPQDAHHEVSLGGVIELAGESVCITCFHGPSFRETERAVFTIDKMAASFSTQAIPGLGRWQTDALTHLRTCQQIVRLSLGEGGASKQALASIHRVSTGKASVPTITNQTNIQEWLAYACIDLLLHPDKFSDHNSTLARLCRKLNVQQVLLVPVFSVSLINDHFWPLEETGTPKVECTLTSKFSDTISVTTTVDHYLFLHDVVKGYIDYLEKHRLKPTVFPSKAESGGVGVEESSCLPHRRFECVCWELNPELCLLTGTVSGQFNPRISWLLEKLGFKEARTTIPKSLQRGAMDPLDKVVSMAVELLVKLTASKKKNLMLIQSSTLQSS